MFIKIYMCCTYLYVLDVFDRSNAMKHRDASIIPMYEGAPWNLEAGKGYYVTRNDSAMIAFRIPSADYTGFQMMASHCDSPVLKIKTNAGRFDARQYFPESGGSEYGGYRSSPARHAFIL